MPDKPIWLTHLDQSIARLEALPFPWVDRQALQEALGVGRRRAQQLLAPLAGRTIGRSVLARREDVVAWLRRLASGDEARYERQRRRRLHAALETLHSQNRARRLLVEAPAGLASRRLESLPDGVRLSAGRIEIEFEDAVRARRLLLELALAIANDPEGFEAAVTG